MRKTLAAVLTLLILSGCVYSSMKQFIGKDARYIQIEEGPPVSVFDLPDGRRAFQYLRNRGTRQVPRTATTSGQVQLIGDTAFYAEQKLEVGGQVVESRDCRVTYLARWDAAQKGWIVTDIAHPKAMVLDGC
jgi:hypothetical protein